MRDVFGIKAIYTSSASGDDWDNNWDIPRMMTSVKVDPDEPKAKMRGSGIIDIKNGTMTMTGSPRYYIHQHNKNVEFTSYFKLNNWQNPPKSHSGFTMVTRSNHHLYKDDPCSARSYYCRLWNNGEIGFQQEYRHGGDGVSYSGSKRVSLYANGIPKNKWIGMKFCVLDKNNETILQIYVDETEGRNGGSWKLIHEVNALIFTKADPCNGPKPIPDGNVSFIRTDAADTVQVKWASIREITDSEPDTQTESSPITEILDTTVGGIPLYLLLIPIIILIIGIILLLYII